MKCEKCQKILIKDSIVYHNLIDDSILCDECATKDTPSDKMEVYVLTDRKPKVKKFSWDDLKRSNR